MKLTLLLALAAVAAAAAAPKMDLELDTTLDNIDSQIASNALPEQRSQVLVNILINQLIAYMRRIINNGSDILGVPSFDPFHMDNINMEILAGLINYVLDIEEGYVTGFGGFVVHRSFLRLSDMTFDLDISVPKIIISAEKYKLVGDLFTAIPIYGDGKALFEVEDFHVKALLHLKQSEDGTSILIDWVENAWFEIPSLKSEMTGVIGGGDIDHIINAVVSEVIIDYANKFNVAISKLVALEMVSIVNPVLDQLETWKYIQRWV